MNKIPRRSSVTQFLLASAGFTLSGVLAFGQAQAPAPGANRGGAAAPAAGGAAPAAAGARGAGGAGGRGAAAPAGPALSVVQQLALLQASVPPQLQANVTAATAALAQASLATPANPADITQKAKALADADLALAMARADEFAKVQKTLEKITPEQAARSSLAGAGGGRGGGASNWETIFDDHTGFVSLFDGKTLNGWDGETNVWDIDDGSIHDDNSKHGGQHHIHYVGPVGAVMSDFDLKVEFKAIGGANAGIQYRSRLLYGHGANRSISDPATMANPLGDPLPAGVTTSAAATAAGITGMNPWQVSGYQFDIYANMSNTGSLYEGQGRGVVGNQGEVVQLLPGGGRQIISKIADISGVQYGKLDDWNKAEIVARGNTMVHILNGRVFCVGIDDNPVARASSGILSLQLEQAGQVWYRSVWLKKLDPVAK